MNKTVATPGLKELLDEQKRNIFLTLNCHAVGVIQEFFPEDQTATVKMAYTKTFMTQNSIGGELVPVQQEYPPLVSVPVIFLGGGTISQTFPVKQGDECLLMFNDRDFNTWFEGTTGKSPASSRLHSFADAVALVGVRSLAHSIENFDEDRWLVKDTNGGGELGLGGSKIRIANQITTLNTQLAALLDVLSILTVYAGLTPVGVIDPTQAAQIQAIKAQIAGLLE